MGALVDKLKFMHRGAQKGIWLRQSGWMWHKGDKKP
jgi:hypothetical protein